jgi:hypothetical protein
LQLKLTHLYHHQVLLVLYRTTPLEKKMRTLEPTQPKDCLAQTLTKERSEMLVRRYSFQSAAAAAAAAAAAMTTTKTVQAGFHNSTNTSKA